MASDAAIDTPLCEAVDKRIVPGVIAIAATASGPLDAGAFGVRRLGDPAPTTLDTVFRIASMTKAITCAAAMQLVEQGKLSLDEPVPAIDPALAAPQVLIGAIAPGETADHAEAFDDPYGVVLLRAVEFRSGALCRPLGMPQLASGKLAALRMPLMFDLGERWEYGINTDWIGRLVEEMSGERLDAYCRDHIFAPLKKKDTGFTVSAEQRARQATVHQRAADGSPTPQPFEAPIEREFLAGGDGLYVTAGDHLAFLQALLQRGQGVIKPETVALMGENHIGELPAGVLTTNNPPLTNDVDLFPGQRVRWGLGYMLTLDPGPNRRRAGMTWTGIFNTYYWLDPTKQVAGLIMTQILPFADPATLMVLGAFERAVYAATGKA